MGLGQGLEVGDSVPSFSWGSLSPFKGSIKLGVRTGERLKSSEFAALFPFIRAGDDPLLASNGDPDEILALFIKVVAPGGGVSGREYAPLSPEDDRGRENPFSRFILSFIVLQPVPEFEGGLLGFGCVPR